MDDIDLKEVKENKVDGALITIIGVGGCGSNTLGHLIRLGIYNDVKNVRLVVSNTDKAHLDKNPARFKIELGTKSMSGLGAGMKPDVGRKAAEENEDEIREILKGSDVVIISAGLGGGTGTGASPVIARIARELGALTIAVVTKPFSMEGSKRAKFAEEGLKELKGNVDSTVLIPNDKLLSTVDKKTGYKESMVIVDNMLVYSVRSICSVVLNSTDTGINVDFEDVKQVMKNKGLSLVSVGEASGDNAAINAIKNAIESPLFDNIDINNFSGLVINFEMHEDFPLQEMSEGIRMITEKGSVDADVMWGTMPNSEMPLDSVRVSIIVTGFDENHSLDSHKPSVSILTSESNESAKETNTRRSSIADFRDIIKRVASSDLSNESNFEEATIKRFSKD